MDSFLLLRLTQYKELKLVNVASGDITLPEPEKEQKEEPTSEQIAQPNLNELIERFKTVLGERVADVRITNRLVESPARLVDKEGELNPELQHVYRVLNREYEAPKKVLEINPQHPILKKLSDLPADHPMNQLIIEQLYENSLLIEGLHPDPANMIQRIQQIIQNALER
jgi:molecular chaperone HtpG